MITKVKSVQANGTWDSPHGLLYKFEYEFEDGVSLHALHKTASPIPAGTEVEYQITKTGDYGNSGKVKKVQSFGAKKFEADPKKQMIIVAQSSMTKAVDILLSGVVDIEVKTINDFVNKVEAVTDLLMTKQVELAKKHVKQYES